MNALLSKLLSRFGFLTLRAEDGDEEAEEPDDVAIDHSEEDTGEDTDVEAAGPVDDDEEQETKDAPPRMSRAQRTIVETKAKLKATEERMAKLEEEFQRNRPVQPDQEQQLYQHEEQRLRAQDLSDQERWQIEANRTLRASQRQSQQALAQANDMADRTSFQTKAIGNATMQKYADRVEKELEKMRAKGQSAPRLALYHYMLGQDIDSGKFKAKTTTTGPKKLPESARGRTTGARSDVQAKSGKTDHQKRMARLANIQI